MNTIGIDLGTTFSHINILHHITVDSNHPISDIRKTIPTIVSFTDDGRYVSNQPTFNPSNTLYNIKKMIGKKISDSSFQNDMHHLPTVITNDEKDNPKIQVEWMGETIELYPEEILAMFLAEIKNMIENQNPIQAVISVPSCFNNAQRQSIIKAGLIAGFNDVHLIDELYAASLSYSILEKNPYGMEKLVLIYSLGSGYFSCSINSINKKKVKIRGIASSSKIGGEYFVNRMIDYFSNLFKKDFNYDLLQSAKAVQKLRKACEKAKIDLSKETSTTIYCPSIYNDHDLKYTITRDTFEELNKDLFKCTIDLVTQVLEETKTSINNVSEIVFLGGSTKIPIVKNLLMKKFNNQLPKINAYPQDCIAYGAMVVASLKYKVLTDENITFNGVSPFSFTLKAEDKYDRKIEFLYPDIKRENSINIPKNKLGENIVTVKIEEINCSNEVHSISEFEIEGISEYSSEFKNANAIISMTEDGVLTNIAVKDEGKNINIKKAFDFITNEMIEKMKEKVEYCNKKDENIHKIRKEKDDFEIYCYSLLNSLSKELLPQNVKDRINQKIEEANSLIESSQIKSADQVTQIYKKLQNDIKMIKEGKYESNQAFNEFHLNFFDNEDEESFDNLGKIGYGGSSETFKIMHKETKQIMCKKILTKRGNFEMAKNAFREYEILQIIDHPCICKAYGINIAEKMKNPINDQPTNETTIAIFLEYIEHPLKDILKSSYNNNSTLKTKIVVEIAHAMNYVHKCKLIHRDLKIDNIMLDSKLNAKLIDFDLVEIIDNDDDELHTEGVGTLEYMSPEMKNCLKYDAKTDVFSFGRVLYYMFVGPFKNKLMPVNVPQPSSKFSKFGIDLMSKCLLIEPSKRPLFEDILTELRVNSYDLAANINISEIENRDKELDNYEKNLQPIFFNE